MLDIQYVQGSNKRRAILTVVIICSLWLTTFTIVESFVDSTLFYDQSISSFDNFTKHSDELIHSQLYDVSKIYDNCINKAIQRRKQLSDRLFQAQEEEFEKVQFQDRQYIVQLTAILAHRMKWILQILTDKTEVCSDIDIIALQMQLDRYSAEYNITLQHHFKMETKSDTSAAIKPQCIQEVFTKPQLSTVCMQSMSRDVLQNLQNHWQSLRIALQIENRKVRRKLHQVNRNSKEIRTHWNSAVKALSPIEHLVRYIAQSDLPALPIDIGNISVLVSAPVPTLALDTFELVDNMANDFQSIVNASNQLLQETATTSMLLLAQTQEIAAQDVRKQKMQLTSVLNSTDDDNGVDLVDYDTQMNNDSFFTYSLETESIQLLDQMSELAFIPNTGMFIWGYQKIITSVDHLLKYIDLFLRYIYNIYIVFAIWLGTYSALPLVDVRQLRPYAHIQQNKAILWFRTLSVVIVLSFHLIFTIVFAYLVLRDRSHGDYADLCNVGAFPLVQRANTHVLVNGTNKWYQYSLYFIPRELDRCERQKRRWSQAQSDIRSQILALEKKMRHQNSILRRMQSCYVSTLQQSVLNHTHVSKNVLLKCHINTTLPTACEYQTLPMVRMHVQDHVCRVQEVSSLMSRRAYFIFSIFVGVNAARIWSVHALGIKWWQYINHGAIAFMGSCTSDAAIINPQLLKRDIGLLVKFMTCHMFVYLILAFSITLTWIVAVILYS